MGCEKDASDTSIASVAPWPRPWGSSRPRPVRRNIGILWHITFLLYQWRIEFENSSEYITELLCLHGLKNMDEIQQCAGVYIYPKEWFCPIDYESGKRQNTENTRMVHHYAASWVSKSNKIKNKFIQIIGLKNAVRLSKIKTILYFTQK